MKPTNPPITRPAQGESITMFGYPGRQGSLDRAAQPTDNPSPKKAKTEYLGTNLDQIPFEALDAIGKIFAEGAKKYGRDNWKKGVNDREYQRERLNHAIRHLMLYANGDRSEPHLAKVGWFVCTQLYNESCMVPDPNTSTQSCDEEYPRTSNLDVDLRSFGVSETEIHLLHKLNLSWVVHENTPHSEELLCYDKDGRVIARFRKKHTGTTSEPEQSGMYRG